MRNMPDSPVWLQLEGNIYDQYPEWFKAMYSQEGLAAGVDIFDPRTLPDGRPAAFDPRFATEEAQLIPSLYTLRQFYRDALAELDALEKSKGTTEAPYKPSHLERMYLGFGNPDLAEFVANLPEELWAEGAWKGVEKVEKQPLDTTPQDQGAR